GGPRHRQRDFQRLRRARPRVADHGRSRQGEHEGVSLAADSETNKPPEETPADFFANVRVKLARRKPSLPATNAKRLREGAKATKQSIHPLLQWRWIASRSLSSGAHSRDPVARNDG